MDVAEVARELSLARRARRVIEPTSRRDPTFSLEDGYAVARFLHYEALEAGLVPVGVKIGFTNQVVWAQLGLERPIWAPMYDKTVMVSRSVSLDSLVNPRIEPEIALGLRDDLAPGASAAEVAFAVAWAAPAFELVQCHYPDWQMSPADAVADAGLHGFLVVGEHVDVVAREAEGLASVEVELRSGTSTVARGRGADVLGGPVEAVRWLMAVPGIAPLRAGSIITTGTLTSAFAVAPGESWALVASGRVPLGSVQVGFSQRAPT